MDPAAFKQKGRGLGLRGPEVYLVVNRINPGFEWVFDDPDTFAVEKLNGTNVKILMDQGRLVELQNRKNVLDPQQILDGRTFILEGVLNSAGKGLVQPDGEQAGELLGPKVNGNPYELHRHEWYPFDRAVESLRYKSFAEHERTFDNWSTWFKDWFLRQAVDPLADEFGALVAVAFDLLEHEARANDGAVSTRIARGGIELDHGTPPCAPWCRMGGGLSRAGSRPW